MSVFFCGCGKQKVKVTFNHWIIMSTTVNYLQYSNYYTYIKQIGNIVSNQKQKTGKVDHSYILAT